MVWFDKVLTTHSTRVSVSRYLLEGLEAVQRHFGRVGEPACPEGGWHLAVPVQGSRAALHQVVHLLHVDVNVLHVHLHHHACGDRVRGGTLVESCTCLLVDVQHKESAKRLRLSNGSVLALRS
eukprot:1038475-Prorocentrum_minimum.AAC.1